MEPVLMLSYYVQLREQLRSSMQFGQGAALFTRDASAAADTGGQHSSAPALRAAGFEDKSEDEDSDSTELAEVLLETTQEILKAASVGLTARSSFAAAHLSR